MTYKTITRQTPMDSIELGDMYFHGWDLVTMSTFPGAYGETNFIYYFREVKHNYNGSK